MAVIGRCESGFLVDHKKSISESVSSLLLSCKETFFTLYEPYFRSSTKNSYYTNGTRKRKRKKSAPVSRTEEELEAALHHHKVRETIAKGVERLVQIGVDQSYFPCENKHVQQNNAVSVMPEDRKDFAGLLANVPSCSRWKYKDLLEPLVIKGENIAATEKDLLDRMISYPCDKPKVLDISGEKYILPANCSFLMSDASNLKPLVSYAQHNGLYNLLVLDPPWFNKSAKRGSKYSFMSLWQMKSLPIPHLLAPGALVGIWVTNKQKYLRFTKTELFPHWSIELVAEWYWVKVTRKGELVTDLDSPHKKPYESLLLGRFTAKMGGLGTSYCSVTKCNESSKEETEFTPSENKSNVLWPQQKRKKINECDDSDEIRKTRCISEENVGSTMLQESTSSLDNHQNGQIDNLQTGQHRNPKKHCSGCDKVDDMKSSSDVVMQKEHTVQEVMELHESICLCETASDLNFVENVQDTKCIMSDTSKHSELLGRGVTSKNYCELLPYHQIICSVPCKIHSRKPPLNAILTQYVPPDSLRLEMFARNLTPHWTSWGNEVLRFQSMEYFDQLAPR